MIVRPETFGRMGNFLFQAACAMAYAWKNEIQYSLPNTTKDPKWNPIYLQDLVNPNWDDTLPQIRIEERSFNFHPLPFSETWDRHNIILDGYWQSEKYFKEWREQILKEFDFPWFCRKGTVSVHVRRGDYLTIKKGNLFKHPPVPKAWIEQQMEKFTGAVFIFFSDDIPWCQQEFGNRKDCAFSMEDEIHDLIMMSQCENQICSASTFSWWGAYLNQNKNKRIIMPKHWLSPGWGKLNMSDVVPEEWERA